MKVRLHTMLNVFLGSLRNARRRPRPQFGTEVSMLESRMMLSAVTWTGGNGDLNWNAVNNWSTHALPNSASDVVINVTQGTKIGGPSLPTTIHSLTITSGNLQLGGSAFEVTNGVAISSGQTLFSSGSTFTSDTTVTGAGTLDLTNSSVNLGNVSVNGSLPNLVLAGTTFTGSGTLTIASGFTLTTDHSIFNVPVVNQGTLQVSSADFTNTAFNGAFSNLAGANFDIVINAAGHGSNITIENGFTNFGTISVESGSDPNGSRLNVPKESLTNAAGGVITFTGATGVASVIFANVVNQGTINVPTGQGYRVSTTNNFTNTATLTGAGTIDFTNCPTVDLGALTITSSVPKFVLTSTTLNGAGTVTINPGVSVAENFSTFNAPLTIKGTLTVESTDFTSSVFNGAVSILAGAHFNVVVNGAGHGSGVNIANGFTNLGTISLESGSGGNGSVLNVTKGTLVNGPSGVITFAGATGAASTTNATLVNAGTINVPSGQRYRVGTSNNFTNTAALTGTGIIDFTGCPTVDLGALTVTNSVPTLLLVNTTLNGSSTLTIGAGVTQLTDFSTFNVPVTVKGTLDVVAEDFTGTTFNGALSILAGANVYVMVNGAGHGSAVAVAHGFTNLGTISLESGNGGSGSVLTVTQGTLVNAAGGTITFTGVTGTASTIKANLSNLGTINVPSGQIYRVSTSSLLTNTGTLTGTGTIDFTGCSTIDLGVLTIASNIPKLVFANSTLIGAGTLTIGTGFTQFTNRSTFNVPVFNRGSLEIVTEDFSNSIFAGPLTNLAGAHFDLLINGAGHGSAVSVPNGFTNSGTITLQAGNGGSGASLTVTVGTLLNSATGVITSQGPAGTFNALSAKLNNVGTINLNSPLTYTGLFSNTGTVNVASTQQPKILVGTIQKPAVLYPLLGQVTWNGSGTSVVPQSLEALSVDVGATAAGFANNSVFGTLALANNTYIKLADLTTDDARSAGAEAVYANTLIVPAGTTLDLNHLHLYATVLNIQGSVLNGTVTQVVYNHSPVGTAKTVTTLEDKSYVFQTADFGYSDPNDTPADQLLAVKITTLPTKGSLTDNGAAVAAGSAVTLADIAAGKLKFIPAANGNGTAYTSFSFQVQDNGGTGNGGIDTDPISRKLTMNVTSVNDAPVGTAKTVTSLEDSAYVIKTADFGFTDPNDTAPNTLLAVTITTLPTIGSLKDNGVAVTAGQSISVTDIDGGKLVFQPNADLSGGPFFLYKFQVQDNGGTANGGADRDSIARVMSIQLTSVNDAPIGTANTVSMTKSTSYTFKVADFGFTDPNDSSPNALLAVQITTLPVLGSLTDNGVTVTAGQRISVADITSGKLKFTPALNGTGAAYANFLFQVQDDGGTTNGGIDLDKTTKTMTISVS